MRTLGVGLLLLLAACVATPPADPNVRACEPLPVGECLTLLQQRNLQAKSVNDVLMAIAELHLSHEKPEPAIEYLDVLKERDDKSALPFRKLGDAFSMWAGQKQTVLDSANDLLSASNYLLASVNYLLASTKDPSNQANYVDATRTAVAAGACEIAESVRQQHEKRFGKNDRQHELAALVHQKCS